MKMLVWAVLLSATAVLGHHVGDQIHAKMSPPESMIELTKECGITKACHTAQKDCFAAGTCVNAVTVVEEGGLYVFELMTTEGVWVAVGISSNDHMSNAAVVECVYDNVTNKVDAFVSWNSPGDINDRVANNAEENLANGVVLLESSYDNGFIYCKYTREPYTVLHNTTFDLIKTPFHLLLASGNNLKPNNVGVAEHDITQWGSPGSQLLHDIGMFEPEPEPTTTPEPATTPEPNAASMLQVFSFLMPAHVMYMVYANMS